MSEIATSAKPRKKKPDRNRGDDGVPPTPQTIHHDQLAAAYHRGASDTLRTIIIAAQAALAKHTQEAPQNEGSHEQPK
jgi:hypothetical protein